MKNETIFHNILYSDFSFVQLFKNFLSDSEILAGLLKLLGMEHYEQHFEAFEVNLKRSLVGDSHQEADLSIKLNNEVLILFEVKVFSSPFTASQPWLKFKHLENLSEAQDKVLVLMISRAFNHLDEFRTRISTLEKSTRAVRTQIVYWEEVCEMIEALPSTRNDRLKKEYSAFLKNWFQVEPVDLSKQEQQYLYNKKFSQVFNRAMTLVHQVFRKLNARNVPVEIEIAIADNKQLDGYGFNLRLAGFPKVFFGILFNFWNLSQKPFCLTMHQDELTHNDLFRNLAEEIGFNPYRKRYYDLIIYTPEPRILEHQNVDNLLVDLIEYLWIKIKDRS